MRSDKVASNKRDSSSRWTVVSDSNFDHEREALDWLRGRLPDREPYYAWANFEFTTQNGQLYEVDALVVTDNGVHLIEVKSYPGEIVGDAGLWQWTDPGGKFRQFDNPRILANRKAKTLKSLIASASAFRKDRRLVPFIEESVFLSDPKLRSGLNVQGRHNVFGRDAEPGGELPAERAALGGIVDHLTTLKPHASGRPRRRIDRAVVDKFVKAVDQVGIRERSSRREVGDFRLVSLLEDVEADTTSGVAYQDFLGRHRSLDFDRRLRVYPLELNATTEQRTAAERAARREFELIRPLDQPGILRPVNYTEHERGPVLIFDYDPDEVSLSAYLADPANRKLSVRDRLDLVRQIIETVAYANGRGVYHRALGPSSVLVTPPKNDGDEPRVRVTNWHTGARTAEAGSSTLLTGTVHSHVEALAAGDAELFRAPEFAQPNANAASLDVFSLGALALFVVTGQRPAASVRQLRSTLNSARCLDPSSVADGVDPILADVVVNATLVDPAERLASAEDLLAYLDLAEEQWAQEESLGDDEPDPLEARRGDRLLGERLEVVQRLGKGSTAVALLVKDSKQFDGLCVAKIAIDPDRNDRILNEASVLAGLQHQSIVALQDEPLDFNGHAGILISYAGPKIDPDRPEEQSGRTLASRLADGPVGVELAQRWGEDLLMTLRYLESMGREHRDIKPENLGVVPRGDNSELHLVLFDFSLAGTSFDAIDAGTPGYLDPFLEKRGRWDLAADRYSAAVTLFEMVTGTRPRYGDGTADPALVAAPPSVDEAMFDSAVAPGLVSFFTKALQPDAADRFGTAEEMYWTWNDTFRTADHPSTPSVHPDEDLTIPPGTTRSTPLAALPLTKRAVSALERAEVLTVGDLLSFPPMQLRSLRGVGARTRGEIREALALLEETVATSNVSDQAAGNASSLASSEEELSPQISDTDSPTDIDPRATTDSDDEQGSSRPATEQRVSDDVPTSDSLVSIANGAVPKARSSSKKAKEDLATILAGLDPSIDPWSSQKELAQALGITSGRVSQLFSDLRTRWLKDPEITGLRNQIRGELAVLQIASVDQVAVRLLLNCPGLKQTPEAMRLARGVTRVAALAEEELSTPRWVMRRRHGTVLLAHASESDDDAAPDNLAKYAVDLGAAAGKLINKQAVVNRPELVSALHRVEVPPGSSPFPDAHLADLAADMCDRAAVNARLELYEVGLSPTQALRASRRAFIASGTFTEEDLQAKVKARFPEAQVLPRRPELDRLLVDAEIDLVWHDAESVYLSSNYDGAPSSTVISSIGRYETNGPASVAAVEIDTASDFEDRLARAHNSGGILVLVADQRELNYAERNLERLADKTASFDELAIRRLDEITRSGKPSFETLVSADASGHSAATWPRLRGVIDRALGELTDEIMATEGTLLLTNLGLLARYDRLDLVAAWRERLHEGTTPLRALWLLVPKAAATELPTVDGKQIPVISRNEWGYPPSDWLRNAHRTRAAASAHNHEGTK